MTATQTTPTAAHPLPEEHIMNPMQTAIRRARRIAAVSALTVAALAVPAASASATEPIPQDPLPSSVTTSPTPTTLELSAQTDPQATLPSAKCSVVKSGPYEVVVCVVKWGDGSRRTTVGVIPPS